MPPAQRKQQQADDEPKALPSNGPEPQSDEQTVEQRQAELAPPNGVIRQGNEPKLGEDYKLEK